MKKTLSVLSALLAVAATQNIQADDSFYASLFGGANWMNTSHHNHHPKGRLDLDTGYLVGGAIGWEWCNDLAFEGEISYRHNKINHFKHKHKEDRHNKGHGNVHSVAYMANGYYAFNFGECCEISLKPYVGFGLGYADTKIKPRFSEKHHRKDTTVTFNGETAEEKFGSFDSSSSSNDSSSSAIAQNSSSSDSSSSDHRHHHHHRRDHGHSNSKSDGSFAYQFIAGLAYELTCEIDLCLEYRYFHTNKTRNNDLVVNLKYGF